MYVFCPALGVELYNLFTHGFLWIDVVVLAMACAFGFLVILFFTKPDRYGRDRYLRDR